MTNLTTRNGDWYYTGPLEPALEEVSRDRLLREYNTANGVHVELGELYGEPDAPMDTQPVAEWGGGPDRETALRFAIGAYYGPPEGFDD